MAMKTTKFTSLADELMLDVFSRLSVKNLIRFQCVSKEFLRLISSPSLKEVRDLDLVPRTPNQHKLALIWYLSDDLEENPYQSLNLYVIDVLDGKLQSQLKLTDFCKHFYLTSGHCQGLVYFYDRVLAKDIYVCNPSTGMSIKLTEPPAASLRGQSRLQIGMGYLPESNTYKIVVWFLRVRNGDFEQFPVTCFEVFTLTDGGKPRSSHWRSLEKEKFPVFEGKPLHYVRTENPKSLCVNGVIYWMDSCMYPKGTARVALGSACVAFDLRTEECRTIPLPATWDYRYYHENDLAELQGSLCAAQRISLSQKTTIWVLRNQNGGWAQKYNIPLYIGCLLTCVPAHASRHHDQDQAGEHEEDLDLVFMELEGRCLCYYNTRNKSVSRSPELSWAMQYGHCSDVYFDTLFNPRTST